MTKQRKNYSAGFKARVAIAAIKGDKTVNEIASTYSVHPNQVTTWKKRALSIIPDAFSSRQVHQAEADEELKARLYQQIGQLKVELDWLKKKSDLRLEDKRRLVETSNEQISLRRQCQLLGLHRSGFYYQPRPVCAENLELMNLLDEQYTRRPFYGVRRMTAWLNQQGKQVNEKRVSRLLREMGLEAIYPKPRLSQKALGAQVYPYLLRDVEIKLVNQVWSTDITYIRLVGGFIYLMAILDWNSRYVLGWEVSVTLDSSFCHSALEGALLRGQPEIFNTDQGSQFRSQSFTGKLQAQGIRESMDGRGRALDNIFVERLWRSVKYEEVYLKDYRSVGEARQGLTNYFEFYNRERLHQSLGYQTPEEVYRQGQKPAAETTLI